MSASCSLVVTCRERAAFLALLYVVFSVFCHFPMQSPVSDVKLDCIFFSIFAFFLKLSIEYHSEINNNFENLLSYIEKYQLLTIFQRFVYIRFSMF